MQNTEIWIFLPKFKVEEKYLLSPILSEMGMKDVFNSRKADLSGMSGRRDLVVSQVHHKAYIEVNEEGTEAAAATGVVVLPVSAQIIPEFKANRPFLLVISDNATRSILFAGKVFSP